jgi:transcription elongation factor GreB
MSKAFTKEDDRPEVLVRTPRAPLPAGTPNYVTRRGLETLRAELARLEDERALAADAPDGPGGGGSLASQRSTTVLDRRIDELASRIATASVPEAPPPSTGEVRFGAEVTWRRVGTETRHHCTIVGVDEADPSGGRVAFVAPLARALLGRTVGEVVTVQGRRGEEELEILDVSYDPRAE